MEISVLLPNGFYTKWDGANGNIRNAPAQEWSISGLDKLKISYYVLSTHTANAGL